MVKKIHADLLLTRTESTRKMFVYGIWRPEEFHTSEDFVMSMVGSSST